MLKNDRQEGLWVGSRIRDSEIYSRSSKKSGHSPVLVAHAVILATWENEIRKLEVRSQPGEIITDPISKNNQSIMDLQAWLKW
jgi:hypothetical protein